MLLGKIHTGPRIGCVNYFKTFQDFHFFHEKVFLELGIVFKLNSYTSSGTLKIVNLNTHSFNNKIKVYEGAVPQPSGSIEWKLRRKFY